MDTAKVKNWHEFQHYKNRCPPWIKLQKSLLDNFEFACLPLASKALAPFVWLLASESMDGELRIDLEWLVFRLPFTEQEVIAGLNPLIEAGFLEGASGVLAERKQETRLEVETEEEEEREEEGAPSGATPLAPKKKAKGTTTLTTYLADCEAEGVKPIPGDDAVFAYAEQVGLPTEFLAMAWQWFKAKYTAGSGKAKRYTDWRATFRNAVKDCWPKYWAIDQSGAYYLTTQGKQAQREFGHAG